MPRPRPLPAALDGQPFTIKLAKAAGLTRRRARALDLASPCHGVRIPASADLTLLVRARSLALATGAVASHLTRAEEVHAQVRPEEPRSYGPRRAALAESPKMAAQRTC